MKYKLPRQKITKEINLVVSRQMKKERWVLANPSRNNLKEIAQIVKTIEKTGLPSYLIKRKLPYNLGYGIFLHPKAKPLKKGQIIAPYAGEAVLSPSKEGYDSAYAFVPFSNIILSQEEQKRISSLKYHPKRRYSLRIDAEKRGNFTRFINHSEKPNVVAYLYTVKENPFGIEPAPLEILYMAKKTILPGEQLLVSYEDGEKSYWGALKMKPFPLTPTTFKLDSKLKIISQDKS